MISYVSIKNFAIIENSEVEFKPGLNIITGETGAGKSIVIEALSLALGARADTSYIRNGCDKAVVQLSGDINGEEIVITRELTSNGRNLCKLNGEVVTLAELSSYCHALADIHGQYDHQSLLNPDYHIHLIDAYDSVKIAPVLADVEKLYDGYVNTKSALNRLISGAKENEKKKDFMRFQLEEITNANLLIGEDEELREKIELLQNSEKIYKILTRVYDACYDGEPSALDIIDSASHSMETVADFTDNLSQLNNRLSELYYELDDIAHEIRHEKDEMVFSQEELDNAISRYDEIETLKRKYGNEFLDGGIAPGTIEAVLSYAATLETELQSVYGNESLKTELEKELEILNEKLEASSNELSVLRKKAAKELESKISEQLKDLNFVNSEFEIHFTQLPDFTANGIDSVVFMISTNPGEPLKPLNKIASGGEMSRIMLAFKKIVADYDGIPTLIFDEIDSGISGIAASVVGKKMKEIAKNHQIICITHLPQIAACGHHNYRIEKTTNGTSTHTAIAALDENATIDEIARLLGGANITKTTRASALELLSASK